MTKIFIPVSAAREEIDAMIIALQKIACEEKPLTDSYYEGRVKNHVGTAGIVLKFGDDDTEVEVPTLYDLIRAVKVFKGER